MLGIDGVRNLCYEMAENDINIAHVAVGGITLEDVLPLIEAGVNGVAVSGAIAFSGNIVEETKKFMSLLPHIQQ